MQRRAPDGEAMVQCPRCAKYQRASAFEGYRVCRYCRTPSDEVEAENARQHGRLDRDTSARYRAQFEARQRHLLRRADRARGYDITKEEHDRLLEAQQYLCAICDQAPPLGKVLHIDHDHETGEVRGLLCPSCNVGLGFFRDDPERLERAIDYLLNPPRDAI